MSFINWDETFILNVREIDLQHKQLADLVNEIYVRVLDHDIDYVCNYAINRLIERTRHHFDTEESIMTQTEYPNIQEHKDIHNDLIEQIKNLSTRLRVELLFDYIEVLAFLRAWLNDHLLEEDTKLVEFLIKSGRKYDVEDML